MAVVLHHSGQFKGQTRGQAPIPWEDEYVGPDMKDLRSMTYVGLHQWVQDNLHDPDILTDVLWAALS